MPKIYSTQDKEELRKLLLQNGLRLLTQNGYRGTDIQDIAKSAGVSRSFFYSLFASREEFVLAAFVYQQDTLLDMLQQALARPQLSREEQVLAFIQQCVENKDNSIFYMTQEDQVDIYRLLRPESFQAHQRSELELYRRMIVAVGKDPARCLPQVVGNLVLSLLLSVNSPASTPFMFTQGFEETLACRAKMLCQYIFSSDDA